MTKVEIGGATLYHGNCFDLLEQFGGLDAIVTDPPYGIGFAGQPTKWQRLAGQEPEAWDDRPIDLAPILALAPTQIVWGGNYYDVPPSRGWLCWFKPDAPPSMAHFELAWTNLDRNSQLISQSIGATNAERVGHPTQKPLRVMEWCVAGIEAAAIGDPFMGSGTTGVACVNLGRRFVGAEIERKYFDLACERVERAYSQQRLFA
jgi:site-specific DNA-methyltransferase (adenine-specific)